LIVINYPERNNMRNHSRSSHVNRQSGVVMIIAVIVILVLLIIAFTTLMTSRTSIKLSADFKNKTSLAYKAEDGVNKALAKINERIGTIRTNCAPNYEAACVSLYSCPAKDMTNFTCLTMNRGPVTCNSRHNPTSASGSTLTESKLSSISCNFIPDLAASDNVYVMVIRQPDHCYLPGTVPTPASSGAVPMCQPSSTGEKNYADARVFLVNSVAKDTSGNQSLVQGVIIVPYSLKISPVGTSGSTLQASVIPHPNQIPYIASWQRGGDYVPPKPSLNDDAVEVDTFYADPTYSWEMTATSTPGRSPSPTQRPPTTTTSIIGATTTLLATTTQPATTTIAATTTLPATTTIAATTTLPGTTTIPGTTTKPTTSTTKFTTSTVKGGTLPPTEEPVGETGVF
jgi:hypothetical protein